MSDSSHELILERALLGSLAAMLPVPLVDDFLLRRSRRALFAALGRATRLRLSEPVLDVLVEDQRRSLLHRAGTGLVARTLRIAAMPLRIAGRARAALETFELATLLEHYARRHHRGLDLDERSAAALRTAIDETVGEVRFGLGQLREPRAHAEALRARFDERWAARTA